MNAESLYFVADTPEGTLELTVPRARLESIANDRGAWSAAFDAVTGGAYVDVGRLLINGDGGDEGDVAGRGDGRDDGEHAGRA